MSDVVSVSRVIPATAEEVFALISNPARHHEIDGSGTVRDAKGEPQQLALGSSFGMSMKLGIPYATVNTVVAYDENRVLAWQTKAPYRFLERFVAGRIWRYELEPVEGGTKVTESWDIRQESAFTKPVVRRAAAMTAKNMTATLERIERVLTKTAQTA